MFRIYTSMIPADMVKFKSFRHRPVNFFICKYMGINALAVFSCQAITGGSFACKPNPATVVLLLDLRPKVTLHICPSHYISCVKV